MHQLAQRARGQLAADRLDRGGAPVGIADGGDSVTAFGGGHHCLGVGERTRQRLLAQHVLARGQQALDDLAVQVVGHHNADRVDIRRIGDRMPVVLGAVVAITLGGVVCDGGVGVCDRDESNVGAFGAEQRGGGPVSGGMGTAGHPAADDGDPDRSRCHEALPFRRWSGR